ncbi:hypothetical protein GWK47_028242 [Chionoecetes opilio]|uniref:Uncharacterized protein n=1 Tax=Chionoecetes opilio TaxID=41210 RepID=A0A8J4YLA1_CHIOP|nr:hypothetical protein GWK47_028242 [Chionoecetes opilio]
MELLQSSGVQDDTATFCVNMTTDLRRYMAENTLPIHGLHTGRSKMFIETNNTQKSEFWDLARNIEKKKNITLLHSQDLLRQMVAVEKSHLEEESSPQIFDYGIAALRAQENAPSNIVQVMGGISYIFVHNTFMMSFFSYFICRGRYVFAFSYASNLLAEKTAGMLKVKTFQILEKRSQS